MNNPVNWGNASIHVDRSFAKEQRADATFVDVRREVGGDYAGLFFQGGGESRTQFRREFVSDVQKLTQDGIIYLRL